MPALPAIALTEFMTCTRSGSATRINAAGLREDVAPDTHRLDFTAAGVPRGGLIEGVDTNHWPNPLFNGALAQPGGQGIPPNGAKIALGTRNGITLQVAGLATLGGDPVLALRFRGTATAPQPGFNVTLSHLGTAFDTALAQFCAVDVQVLAGSKAGFTALRLNGGAGATTRGEDQLAHVSALPWTVSFTKPVAAGTTAQGSLTLAFAWPDGAVLDGTFGLARPRAYRAPAAMPACPRRTQSLIRPTPGHNGPVTRQRDALRFARVDWWQPDRMADAINVGSSFLFAFTLAATPITDAGLWRIDDGSANNRMEAYVAAGTRDVTLRRVIGGSVVHAAVIGSVGVDAACRLLVAATAAEMIAVATGGGIQPVTIGAPFTPARALLGSITADDTTPLWGHWRGAFFYQARLANGRALDAVDTAVSLETLRIEGHS